MPFENADKPRSYGKIFGLICVVFFILVVICILAMPTLLSTGVGKKILIQTIQNRSPLTLNMRSLSLNWFGGQEIEGIQGENRSDQFFFECENIRTDAPLWKILWTNDLGNLTLLSPQLKISKAFTPAAHAKIRQIQRAGFAQIPSAQISLPALQIPLQGHVVIEKGKIDLSSPGVEPILFDQIEMSMDLSSGDATALQLHAVTMQQKNQGEIAIRASAEHPANGLPTLSVNALMDQLPVQGLDQLCSLFYPQYSGLLLSAIGPTLRMEIDLNSSAGNLDLNFNARSNELTAQMQAQSSGGILSLKNPAAINFNLTPQFFQYIGKLFPPLSSLKLMQPGQLQCSLNQFTLPLPSKIEEILQSSFSFSFNAPPQLLFAINETPISLNGLTFSASSTALYQGVTLSFKGAVGSSGQTAPFSLNGSLHPVDAQGNTGEIAFDFSQTPTQLIGGLAQIPLAMVLGPQVNIQGNLVLNPQASKIHCAVKAPCLSLPSLDFSLGDALTLLSPFSFTYQLTPELLKGWNLPLQIAQPSNLEGNVQNLVLPLKAFAKANMNLQLNLANAALTAPLPLAIPKLQTSLSLNTLDNISLEIDGTPVQAKIAGALNLATREFMAKKPVFLQITLDNPLIKALFPSATPLAQPTQLQCNLDPFSLPLSSPSLEAMKINGAFKLDQLGFALPQTQVALNSLTLPFQWDGKGKTANIELKAAVKNPSGDAGSIQGQASCSQFLLSPAPDFKKAIINGSIDLQNIASSFVEALTAQPGIANLIGTTFSGKCKIQSGSDKQNIALNWASPYLNFNTAFTIDNTAIQLQGTNSQISWTLTPDGYQILDRLLAGPSKGLIPFELQEVSTFTIGLSKLNLPISGKQEKLTLLDRIPKITWDLSQLQSIFAARNPKLTFFDKSSQELIQLSGLSFTVDKSSGKGPLLLSLDSSILSKNTKSANAQNAKVGTLSLSEKLVPFYDAQGNFDFSKLTSTSSLTLQQFPTRIFDLLARIQGRTDFPFSILFGDVINATFNAELKDFTGPVNLNINTPNTRASLAGNAVNGALLLSESLHAQMKITPEMSRLVLREINPLNLSYIYSSDPVTLEILSQGFYLPLYPFDSSKMAIPEAHIELGKISCRNEGNVGITLGLLKSNQFNKKNDLMLWFAPLSLHIKQGIADIERTEILIANTFDIAIWGKVDLAKDYVDMILGLTASTLTKAFGIKNLPENYVLTIPMRGKMDNVQIDSSKATSKVALLLAWQKAEELGAVGGGPAGGLIGGLVNKMATLPDSNAKVPPPKHPFPWEGGKTKKKQTSNAPGEKKKHFKQKDKPLKQILKVIR